MKNKQKPGILKRARTGIIGGLAATLLASGCASSKINMEYIDSVETSEPIEQMLAQERVEETDSLSEIARKALAEDIPSSELNNPVEKGNSGVMVKEELNGAMGYIKVPFEYTTEIFTKDFWKRAGSVTKDFIYSHTQPLHPYHTKKDEKGAIVVKEAKNGKTKKQKVIAPFYRVIGENQADSVVGIVYDKRYNDGLRGSHWFAGWKGDYNEHAGDKIGKSTGLFLLLYGGREVLDGDRSGGNDDLNLGSSYGSGSGVYSSGSSLSGGSTPGTPGQPVSGQAVNSRSGGRTGN